jgi:hypothetical protein
MSPSRRGRRQTRLFWQRRHFDGSHNNIQDPNQQHPLDLGRRHDDDGHKELLSPHPVATV